METKNVLYFIVLLFLLLFVPKCSKILKRKRYRDIDIYYLSFLPDSVKGLTLISDHAIPVDWYFYYPDSFDLLRSNNKSDNEVIIVVTDFLLNSSFEFRDKLDSFVDIPFLITNSKKLQNFVRINKGRVRIAFLNFQKTADIPLKRALGRYINLMKQTADIIVGVGDQPEFCDNFDFCFEEENSLIKIKFVNDEIKEIETEDIEEIKKTEKYEVNTEYISNFLEKHQGSFLLPYDSKSLLAPLIVIEDLTVEKNKYRIFGKGSPYYKPFEGEKDAEILGWRPWLLFIKEQHIDE